MSTLVSTLRTIPVQATVKPERVFWIFIVLHLVLWTTLPAITSPNAPLDVIEGYAWGREWLWGTYKHPPMQAWILEILATVTDRASWAHFLGSQLAVIIAFWAVWDTGRKIMGETQALIGTMLLEGIIYYNFTSTEFNPNVLQLTFWALTAWSFYRAVKNNHVLDWFLLGIWGAAGLYTKYSTALLLGVFVVMIATRPEARRCLKKPGPYIAALTTILLFLPHMYWLQQHDYLPFTYLHDRLQSSGPATKFVTPPDFFPTFLMSPIVFVIAQILALLPATLLFLFLKKQGQNAPKQKIISNFDRAFLAAVTFVPMTLTLLLSMCFGFKIHDMWGAPFFNFAGLWAISKFYPEGARMNLRFFSAWVIIFFAGVFGFAGTNYLTPYINLKPLRIHFAGRAVAETVDRAWHEHYNEPLKYVIGNTWGAGNVAYYAHERPHLYINGDPGISTWIDPEDVKKHGGVIVWCMDYCIGHGEATPEYIHTSFPQAQIQEPLKVLRKTDAEIPPVVIGWAIVPPQTKLSQVH
jgi:4-amino-4-deoxy-L-arabinose transferase-like glycosyltransferase